MMRRSLRLVFVATLPEPGGAACHLVSLTSALTNAGHRVAVVADPQSALWRTLAAIGRVELHAGAFTRAYATKALRAVQNAIESLAADGAFAVFERDYWGTGLVAAGTGVPVAFFLHHAGMKRSNRMLLPRLRWHFVVPSRDLRQWLKDKGVSATRIHVLYNDVDTAAFAPDPARRARERARLGVSDDAVLVGYVGRLEANKGVVPFAHALTRAMQRDERLRALWVGEGRLEATVDAIIQQSGLAARHIRRPWTDDVRAAYAAMDLLALPSTKRESFGRVLIEAQACGVPVLGSDIGGIPEAMKIGVTGRLVAPGDIGAWADALVALAADEAGRHRMGAAAVGFVRRTFDSAVAAAAFANWWATWRAAG
jgi:glycosyltransferase involved in cell wall biosynthesis